MTSLSDALACILSFPVLSQVAENLSSSAKGFMAKAKEQFRWEKEAENDCCIKELCSRDKKFIGDYLLHELE